MFIDLKIKVKYLMYEVIRRKLEFEIRFIKEKNNYLNWVLVFVFKIKVFNYFMVKSLVIVRLYLIFRNCYYRVI